MKLEIDDSKEHEIEVLRTVISDRKQAEDLCERIMAAAGFLWPIENESQDDDAA